MSRLMPFLLTCDPGLEDACAMEANSITLPSQISIAEIEKNSSTIQLNASEEAIPELLKMRTIYHLGFFLTEIKDSSDGANLIETICKWAETAGVTGITDDTPGTFRVLTERNGQHPFNSNDVERAVGAIFVRRSKKKVNLKNADTILRIEIRKNNAKIGLQINREPLDKRWKWEYRPRVSLRTTIAAAMLIVAKKYCTSNQTDKSDNMQTKVFSVIDPFCGSGTTLLEASVAFPSAELFASDNDPEAVAGTIRNALVAGVADRINIEQLDARELGSHFQQERFDICLANTPFGIRMGTRINFRNFYAQLLDSLATVMRPGGVCVLLIGKKRGLFNYVLKDKPEWQQCDARVIEIGGSFPGMFVLRKI